MAILKQEWFRRDTPTVALELLGKMLVRRMEDGHLIKGIICETEAYDGVSDKACHASKGKTERTSVMFGDAGVWYVYLCYGVHWMLNVTTREPDYPAAVLIRGVTVAIGPGRVSKSFGIDKRLNKCRAEESSGLWIEDSGIMFPKESIQRGPRIGVDYAGPIWSEKAWRFYVRK